MKSNNQYLESINESVSGQMVDERKPNNWYLRSIAKNTGSQEIHGHRTDNYYLKRIALNMEDLDVKELLETIAELRGEVEDLEEQLANDIHLFSCCKDIVQTGESLGLFAYCKHNGEVEGNTVHFYVVDNRTPSSITVSSDKTILSYEDDDKATLTITVLDDNDDPLSDYDVIIKNGSTVLDTVQTGSDGTVEYEYSAQGLGDVTLTIECEEVSETITIEDCLYYHSNAITDNQELSISNFPTNFKVTYTSLWFNSGDNKKCCLEIGEDANNNMFFGALGDSSSSGGIYKRINGTKGVIDEKGGINPSNSYVNHEFRYSDGELYYKGGYTNPCTGTYEYTVRDYISTNIGTGSQMTELKIKPL